MEQLYMLSISSALKRRILHINNHHDINNNTLAYKLTTCYNILLNQVASHGIRRAIAPMYLNSSYFYLITAVLRVASYKYACSNKSIISL